MAIRNYQRAFNGGEVSPSMYARIDDGKYQTGMAQCKNFLIEPQGPIVMRPGFKHVDRTKYADKKARLIPFNFSISQTMVLEFGEKYVRFHTQGQTVLGANGQPYEIATPYLEADLFEIHYVQSADVMTLVHPNYPPKELRRYGATDWRLVDIRFGSSLSAPTGLSASQTINQEVKNPTDYKRTYAVTALLADGTEESVRSSSVTLDCNPYGDGSYNTIRWNAVAGAGLYRVYRDQGGVWAYVGQTDTTQIVDENITPDASITPPIYDTVFKNNDYPGAVSYFEQRRWFGGTRDRPNNLWATRPGTEADMSYSLPSQSDDRIAVRVAAREANRILHIVPLSQLMLMTGAAEWRVSPLNSDAITPESMSVRPQSYVGASNVPPLVVGSSMIYGAGRGGHLRELGYNYEAGGYISGDVCLRAPHLFDNLTIVDLAYSKAPSPVVWAVSSSGKMVAMAYVPEQQVGGFSTIETKGSIESACVVAEGDEDIVYVEVMRTVNGQAVRFVERMNERQYKDLKECVYVDCAATYRGEAKKEITGLTWLEGETVSILADGAVEPQQVVKDGKITLTYPAEIVHVGLPFTADMKTLPVAMALQDGSYGSGHKKNVREVFFRVVNSSGTQAGPSFDKLSEYPSRSTEFAGNVPEPITDEIGFQIQPQWSQSGQVCVRQKYPLPLRIVSMTTVLELS